MLSTNLATFTSQAAGATSAFDVFFDRSALGVFSASYQLDLSDEDIAGAQTQTLTLNLMGIVVPEPATGLLTGLGLIALGLGRKGRRDVVPRLA